MVSLQGGPMHIVVANDLDGDKMWLRKAIPQDHCRC